MSCRMRAPRTTEEVRLLVRAISAKRHAKENAGICVWPDCERAALKDRSWLFFGDDHCATHAVQAEIEALEDEQSDDARGRHP